MPRHQFNGPERAGPAAAHGGSRIDGRQLPAWQEEELMIDVPVTPTARTDVMSR
jgi:hypothetical protein